MKTENTIIGNADFDKFTTNQLDFEALSQIRGGDGLGHDLILDEHAPIYDDEKDPKG